MNIKKIYKPTKKLIASAFLCFLWSLFLQSCGVLHDDETAPVIENLAQDSEIENDFISDSDLEIMVLASIGEDNMFNHGTNEGANKLAEILPETQVHMIDLANVHIGRPEKD